MNILNIWHSGGVTEALIGFAVIISGILWYQVIKAVRSGSQWQDLQKGTQYSDENIPFYKMPKFWLGIVVWVLIICAIAFIVAPDYKGI